MTEGDRQKLNRRTFLLGLAGLGMLSWTATPALAYQPFEPFNFAFVTDVHLCNDIEDSYKLTRESQLFLQQLVKQLNSEKLDFVVFGGDQVETVGKDEANWQLFLDVLQGLNAPFSFVLGESDVSGNLAVDKRKTFGPDWKSRGIETDTSYWSHNLSQVPNVHLVGLDTSMPNSTTGGVSQRQLDWLKKDLGANKKFFTIVFCHHPLLPPPPYDGGPPWDEYIIPDGGAVREIIGAFPNVKMVLSGHTHVTKVQNEKDVWHISSPSLCVYPCAYRVFNVTPDMVTMETKQIEFPALIKKAKKQLVDSSLADRYSKADPASFLEVVEGTKDDREALLPMGAGKQLESYTPKKVKKPKEEKPAEKEPEKEPAKKPKKEKKQKKEKPEKAVKTKKKKQDASPKPVEAGPTEPTKDILPDDQLKQIDELLNAPTEKK